MNLSQSDRSVVENLFKAMQAGAAGETAMMALFHDDAVLIAPFSGSPQTYAGATAIRNNFREMWQQPLPDMRLELGRVDLDGALIRAEWTCHSTAFPTPMRGHDLFTLREGRIARLEINVTDMPNVPH